MAIITKTHRQPIFLEKIDEGHEDPRPMMGGNCCQGGGLCCQSGPVGA